jgi:hypothetical protein
MRDVGTGEWCLVEKGLDGHWYMVKRLDSPPTTHNTTEFLNRMRSMWYGIEEFEDQVDAAGVAKERDLEKATGEAREQTLDKVKHAHPDHIQVGVNLWTP